MFHLALRQLLFQSLRTVLTALAISAVIAVILVLRGFEYGLYVQLRTVVMNRGADLIVAQAGVSNFLAVRSSLRQLLRGEVELLPGIKEAHPITGLPVIYDQDGTKTPIWLLVYDTRGGPIHIDRGTPIEAGRDVVIDLALAEKHGLEPGSELIISDFAFRVAGITTNSSALFMPFVFVNYDGLIDFFIESEIAPDISTFPLLSFLLVELMPGAEPKKVMNDIESTMSDVDVLTPAQMARKDVQLGKDMFGPIMGLLINVAYIIGLLVVGLIIFADVRARLRTFGVLKALGFRMRHFTVSITVQTLLLLIVAFPIGMLVAHLIGSYIEWAAPLYLVPVLEPLGILKTLVACVIFALLGGTLPLRLIAKTDPTIAFQGII